jgi:catechol 2,3-dioxygenase-like lactoylglutathione lyase family enzyme
MKRIASLPIVLFLCLSATADERHLRPPILGIAGVHFYSTNVKPTKDFYSQVLGTDGAFSDECLLCEDPPAKGSIGGPGVAHGFPVVAQLNSGQQVILSDLPTTPPQSLLYEIVFAVDNVQEMRKYLFANGVSSEALKSARDSYFTVTDPEGHRIGFTKAPQAKTHASGGESSMRVIHAGIVVHDRAAEDHFYKDILGFHVYWHGGMKEGEDNWVDMQVPDGTDWIEYMLRVSPDASHKTLGVMNHIALGVPNIQAAKEQLIKNGWKGTEEPKIGRDGKWQLNLYDPDETRVELMEFKPTKEPCCSAYTGPHPGPQQ